MRMPHCAVVCTCRTDVRSTPGACRIDGNPDGYPICIMTFAVTEIRRSGPAVPPPLKRMKASIHACIICVNGSAAAVAPVGGISSALAASIWQSPAGLRSPTAICISLAVRSCVAA